MSILLSGEQFEAIMHNEMLVGLELGIFTGVGLLAAG